MLKVFLHRAVIPADRQRFCLYTCRISFSRHVNVLSISDENLRKIGSAMFLSAKVQGMRRLFGHKVVIVPPNLTVSNRHSTLVVRPPRLGKLANVSGKKMWRRKRGPGEPTDVTSPHLLTKAVISRDTLYFHADACCCRQEYRYGI
jgi:hypothetical protein